MSTLRIAIGAHFHSSVGAAMAMWGPTHFYVILLLSVISLVLIIGTHFIRPINGERIAIAVAFALIPWLLHSFTIAFIASLVIFIVSLALFFMLAF